MYQGNRISSYKMILNDISSEGLDRKMCLQIVKLNSSYIGLSTACRILFNDK